jgi:hypothetical protein
LPPIDRLVERVLRRIAPHLHEAIADERDNVHSPLLKRSPQQRERLSERSAVAE